MFFANFLEVAWLSNTPPPDTDFHVLLKALIILVAWSLFYATGNYSRLGGGGQSSSC